MCFLLFCCFRLPLTTNEFDNCVCVAFGAVLQGSLFGLVGLLPQKYSAVFMSGQGLAGTFAALAMLSAIASESQALVHSHTLCLKLSLVCNGRHLLCFNKRVLLMDRFFV